MGHNHSHHNHNHENASKNIVTAFVLNSIFVVIELVGGLLTNSIAILSDALHDFGDCISLAVAWGLQKKSLQKGDERYSYGYKRFSLLGSVFLSGILTVSSLFVITEAVKRIFSPEPVDATGMLWLAILGVLINGAAALKLKKGETLNEKAVFLHIMEDVLGWIAVLIVSVVMMFANIPVLDPLLSIAISIWVLSNVYKNMRDTFRILLQGIPENVNLNEIREQIGQIPGVESVHDLHIWTQDGVSHVMTLHVVIPAAITHAASIREQIHTLGLEYGITHTTLEFENPGSGCEYISGCQ